MYWVKISDGQIVHSLRDRQIITLDQIHHTLGIETEDEYTRICISGVRRDNTSNDMATDAKDMVNWSRRHITDAKVTPNNQVRP